MYEANTVVVGNVVTHPVRRSLPGGDQVVTFRMASNSRRFDRDSGGWVDNGTLYLTVNCWRRLVEGVDASIRRGDPIIAYGQLRSTEYCTKDGVQRRDLEMRASAVGPDLARCSASVVRRGAGNSPIAPAVVDQVGDEPRERPQVESEAFDSVEVTRDDIPVA
ncbi:single-stranded DNA-binding protein [Nocardia sp. NPDC051570]|uniref:single-stranded DNA-binding protein n=1 Tax=Nocardia sp. NPDC051570 TaxID=3364324 RepID=UPI003797E9C7